MNVVFVKAGSCEYIGTLITHGRPLDTALCNKIIDRLFVFFLDIEKDTDTKKKCVNLIKCFIYNYVYILSENA